MSILFYSPNEPFGYLSNFFPSSIKLNGKTWKTTEHYFQAQKFAGTKWESEIRMANSPGIAAREGRRRDLPLRRYWESVKDNIMREAIWAKFSQHEELRNKLLATGDAELVEHTYKDKYWADGGDGSGKNMLGRILMEIRDRIKQGLSVTTL